MENCTARSVHRIWVLASPLLDACRVLRQVGLADGSQAIESLKGVIGELKRHT